MLRDYWRKAFSAASIRKDVETALPTNAKVLIIDDDQDILDSTGLLLETRGFRVHKASNPEDGMRELEEGKPDLIVLDVMMPHGTEGFQMLWSIRRHPDPALRDTPMIMLTSIHDTTRMRFREGDADETGEYLPVQGFLDKPVDPDKLSKKIEAILGKTVQD